jgi:hypothetical protein
MTALRIVLVLLVTSAAAGRFGAAQEVVTGDRLLGNPSLFWPVLLRFVEGNCLVAGRIERAATGEYVLRDYVVLGGDRSSLPEGMRLFSYDTFHEGWYLLSCVGSVGSKSAKDWETLEVQSQGMVAIRSKDDPLVVALKAPGEKNQLRRDTF